MGLEESEPEPPFPTPKLPLLSIPSLNQSSPERSGMLTPPLQTSASVPFRWEEEPGKPRPSTALIIPTSTTSTPTPTPTTTYCLELPPRLQLINCESRMTKMPSPTTVLEGPYVFQSSSFRFVRERRQGSFGGGNSGCGSPERSGQFGNSIVLSSKGSILESKGRGGGGGGLFGSWRKKPSALITGHHNRGKSEVGGGSFVFPSSSTELGDIFGGSGDHQASGARGKVKKMSRNIRRNGSFSSLSQVRSHFWATMFEGFKQVLPWKTATSKKDGLSI